MLWTETNDFATITRNVLESPSNLPAPQESYIWLKKNNKPEICDKHNFMCKVILQQPVQAGIANSSFWSGQQM